MNTDELSDIMNDEEDKVQQTDELMATFLERCEEEGNRCDFDIHKISTGVYSFGQRRVNAGIVNG